MFTEYITKHFAMRLQSSFVDFTTAFEQALGRIDLKALAAAGQDREATRAAIEGMQGIEGLSLFHTEELGQLLSLNGSHTKAKRYFVGNFLRAEEILRQEIRLGLYAPIRVLVYESAEGVSFAEFELPSSQFARFGNERILQSGLGLDQKIAAAITGTDTAK